MTYRERLHLTWNLTWPLVLIDALWPILLHSLIESGASTADSFFQALSFFVLGPLAVRWAIEQGSSTHQIVARKNGQDARLSASDAFSVFWLLAWRALPIVLLALVPLSLLLKSVAPPEATTWIQALAKSPTANSLGLTTVDLVINLSIVPFLIPVMLRKRYKRFTLDLRPREHSSIMKSVSRKATKRNLSNR